MLRKNQIGMYGSIIDEDISDRDIYTHYTEYN